MATPPSLIHRTVRCRCATGVRIALGGAHGSSWHSHVTVWLGPAVFTNSTHSASGAHISPASALPEPDDVAHARAAVAAQRDPMELEPRRAGPRHDAAESHATMSAQREEPPFEREDREQP